jgi:acyl-CoA synthetase (AMP-forming)/AMP-acid ligase II
MNIAERLDLNAQKLKDKAAVSCFIGKEDKKVSLTHFELWQLTNQYTHRLNQLGVERGDKVLMFVRPSLDFPALVFALFKLGAVPVLMDPGMGIRNLLHSIKQVRPKVFLAEPLAFLLRLLFPTSFRTVRKCISVGNSFGLGKNIKKNIKSVPREYQSTPCDPDDLAAILFTSGGTGIPKGVEYTHKIFSTQTDMLKQMFFLNSNEVDLACFPLFALFTIAIGMEACFPQMNFSKPATVDPVNIHKAIDAFQVTFAAGSPAIWDRVADYCLEHKIELPSIKYLVMFGAPISVELHEKLVKILPNGNTYTPYGATESLPISCIDGKTILKETAKLSLNGAGTCVGAAVPGVKLCIIPLVDGPIEHMKDIHKLSPGRIGEICVKGDMVTKSYHHMSEKTEEAKIQDDTGFWHRMGDVGYLDQQKRLWFCGRKSHRVEYASGVDYSIPVESFFNQHPLVKRTALVKVKDPAGIRPALVVERKDGRVSKDASFYKELQQIASGHEKTQSIQNFFLYKDFPVDGRHNIKIDRLALSSWAQKRYKKPRSGSEA